MRLTDVLLRGLTADLVSAQTSDKILWLLRRVAGVRHILITESRLPDSGPVVFGDRRASAPNLEARSAWRTARCHRTTEQADPADGGSCAKQNLATRPTAGVGAGREWWAIRAGPTQTRGRPG